MGRIDRKRKQQKRLDKQHPLARERFKKLLDLACRGALEGKEKPRKHKVR